jgi:hypothetical protein
LRCGPAAAFVPGWFVPTGPSARLRIVIVVGFLGAPGEDGALARGIARRAAATGARVEMIGVAPVDAEGDTWLLELAAAVVGHATVVRSRADRLEPADVDLALRYLPDVHAIVLVAPDPSLIPPAAAASGWSGAGLVILARTSGDIDADAAPQAVVLEPPAVDRDGTFAGLVAALATRLDAGDDPRTAWQSTVSALAVDPVGSGPDI